MKKDCGQKKLEISHPSQILTHEPQILVLSWLSNYYCTTLIRLLDVIHQAFQYIFLIFFVDLRVLKIKTNKKMVLARCTIFHWFSLITLLCMYILTSFSFLVTENNNNFPYLLIILKNIMTFFLLYFHKTINKLNVN